MIELDVTVPEWLYNRFAEMAGDGNSAEEIALFYLAFGWFTPQDALADSGSASFCG